MLDTKFFKLEFQSAKKVGCPNSPGSSRQEIKVKRRLDTVKGKKCEKECKYDMGDLVTLKLMGQAHGSVMKDFNDIFRLSYVIVTSYNMIPFLGLP